jgi:hypothetical protein
MTAVLQTSLLTQVAEEEKVGEEPPYFPLFEYQVCVEVHIEGGDDLQTGQGNAWDDTHGTTA